MYVCRHTREEGGGVKVVGDVTTRVLPSLPGLIPPKQSREYDKQSRENEDLSYDMMPRMYQVSYSMLSRGEI